LFRTEKNLWDERLPELTLVNNAARSMHCNKALSYFNPAGRIFLMDHEAEIFYRRGTALACVGRSTEAIEWFYRALECDPACGEAHVALATAVDCDSLFREAILSYDHTLGIDNQIPDVWFVKGRLMFRLSYYKEAGDCFRTLVLQNLLPAFFTL